MCDILDIQKSLKKVVNLTKSVQLITIFLIEMFKYLRQIRYIKSNMMYI